MRDHTIYFDSAGGNAEAAHKKRTSIFSPRLSSSLFHFSQVRGTGDQRRNFIRRGYYPNLLPTPPSTIIYEKVRQLHT